MLSVPALAGGMSPCGAVDVLGRGGGIFESESSAFHFPEFANTNFDRLTVGNDRAMAFGGIRQRSPLTTATNNLMIEKNQDSGDCDCCDTGSICQECCLKVNMEQIRVGNRDAMAFGAAVATNNVKIITNQQ
jgi:hypothetical protein